MRRDPLFWRTEHAAGRPPPRLDRTGYVTGPGGRGWVTARGHPAVRSAFAARASATAMDGHALHSPVRARPHAIEGAYCPSPDERSQPPSHVPTGESQPQPRGESRSMASLRRVRSEYRGACPPWRELQPAERAHHPEPHPVYARLRRHSPFHRSVILGSWILSRYDDVLAVCEGPRAVLQRPALAKHNRERAPARAGRLQHPARRPAGTHATSQGRGARVHPTEADDAGADHRGARQRHR